MSVPHSYIQFLMFRLWARKAARARGHSFGISTVEEQTGDRLGHRGPFSHLVNIVSGNPGILNKVPGHNTLGLTSYSFLFYLQLVLFLCQSVQSRLLRAPLPPPEKDQ